VNDGKRTPKPEVGIIYLVGEKLWFDTTPVARAGTFGDFSFHEQYHCQYWEHLVKTGVVPNTEYEQYPRGRVSYNRKTGRFVLLADPCILREKNIVTAIFSQMHLQARGTETGTDSLYRCFRCLGPSR
jgi:hypothetical protein